MYHERRGIASRRITILTLALAILAFPMPASALPAYAFSMNDISLFFITPSAAITGPPSIVTGTVAEFGSFGEDSASGELDVRQAKSGPGPFPDENIFQPQGMTGRYARADSLARLGFGTFFSGQSVAEVFRTSDGTADALAGVSVELTLTQLQDAPINFSFVARPMMAVQAALQEEHAFASLGFRLELFEGAGTTPGTRLLLWTPNGDPENDFVRDGGVVTDVRDPFSLNMEISAPGNTTYSPGGGTFSISYRREVGQAYMARITFAEEVSVSIPQASSLVLLIAGLAGLGFAAIQKGSSGNRVGDAIGSRLGGLQDADMCERARPSVPLSAARLASVGSGFRQRRDRELAIPERGT
jgi:hypothetical protein